MAATLTCRECCPDDSKGALDDSAVAVEEGGRSKKCFFLFDDVAMPERQMDPDVRLNETSDSDSTPILDRWSGEMKGIGGGVQTQNFSKKSPSEKKHLVKATACIMITESGSKRVGG